MTAPRSEGGGVQGPALVVLAISFTQIGSAVAAMVFTMAGPVGTVALRLGLSALVLWLVVRPGLRGVSRLSWAAAAGYGLVLAAMNVLFYLAIDRIPLGTAVTLELLGPLTLSVITGRRWLSLLWAVVAGAGVVLLSWNPSESLDPLGVVFALGAGVMWACYILLTRAAGRHFAGLAGMTLGMSIGALAVVPFAVATTGAVFLRPEVLLAGLGVALLSSTIPYALEMRALRSVPPSMFAVLLALSPAVAALSGLVLLGQDLGVVGYLGIVCVVVAGVGATRTKPRAG
ncbi:EamA family transporter [Nesterenkonia marinintestina]|uniref:EamA family transporter n=1 Tax=Nesterenkonia marinintestina TaxID=2979865 RepID=UPI0021C2202C|nr:EamA family transporter [Nesterenkonia sp. GX14115]